MPVLDEVLAVLGGVIRLVGAVGLLIAAGLLVVLAALVAAWRSRRRASFRKD
jgi:predicted PurR-regulated permease PerM